MISLDQIVRIIEYVSQLVPEALPNCKRFEILDDRLLLFDLAICHSHAFALQLLRRVVLYLFHSFGVLEGVAGFGDVVNRRRTINKHQRLRIASNRVLHQPRQQVILIAYELGSLCQ